MQEMRLAPPENCHLSPFLFCARCLAQFSFFPSRQGSEMCIVQGNRSRLHAECYNFFFFVTPEDYIFVHIFRRVELFSNRKPSCFSRVDSMEILVDNACEQFQRYFLPLAVQKQTIINTKTYRCAWQDDLWQRRTYDREARFSRNAIKVDRVSSKKNCADHQLVLARFISRNRIAHE